MEVLARMEAIVHPERAFVTYIRLEQFLVVQSALVHQWLHVGTLQVNNVLQIVWGPATLVLSQIISHAALWIATIRPPILVGDQMEVLVVPRRMEFVVTV